MVTDDALRPPSASAYSFVSSALPTFLVFFLPSFVATRLFAALAYAPLS